MGLTHNTGRAITPMPAIRGSVALALAGACAIGWIGVSGCAGASDGGEPARQGALLGRTIAAQPPAVRAAPAPVGDPPSERGGTLPSGKANTEDMVARGAGAASPQAALRRYALLYSNWNADGLAARERQLAALSAGPARLAAEQTSASGSDVAALAAEHVRNNGVVVAIACGEGAARGWWVVVTRERTSGSGVYAGLPAGMEVTEARVVLRRRGGWVVSEWWPER